MSHKRGTIVYCAFCICLLQYLYSFCLLVLQMDGKVRVAVRSRPLIPLEINEGCQTCVDFRPELNQVLMSDSRCFTFDFVFPPTVTQTEVYEACAKNFIQFAFEGLFDMAQHVCKIFVFKNLLLILICNTLHSIK